MVMTGIEGNADLLKKMKKMRSVPGIKVGDTLNIKWGEGHLSVEDV